MQHGRSDIPLFRPALVAGVAALAGLLASTGLAQPAPPVPSGPPETEPTLPSLDDLLGLESSDDGADANQRALERKLTAEEAGERFQQAVGLMGDAAQRIGDRDLGLQTQRLQEEILRNLDQVIESAKQNQGGGGGSSSSSSSSQSQQPNQSTQQQQPGSPGSESDSEQMAPGLTGVEMAPGVAPDGVTWGNLPERDREAVSQGVSDRYSALYRRLTELYYRKLAEREEDR